MATFEIRNLTFAYPEADRYALKQINLTIEAGEFIVLCGKSGCGKSTLLRHFKTVLTPHGSRTGELYYKGTKLETVSGRVQSSEIGYVLQSPENQIVTDKVWHELAFGLESLGYDNKTIRLRVAEMASYFGIQDWFHKKVTELSGGQKQLLNLASIMAMQPSLLILDEPTSQLDPIAAGEFLSTIKKINQDLGTTIVLSEHRLEEVMTGADRVMVMDQGEIIAFDTPRKIGTQLREQKNDMFIAMPAPMQICAGIENTLAWPLTVREGRRWLENLLKDKPLYIQKNEKETLPDTGKKHKVILELKDIWFKYEKKLPDVLRDVNFTVDEGDFYALVGGNGTGKSTTLAVASGLRKPYRGKVFFKGKAIKTYSDQVLYQGLIGVLPQNPQSLFVKNTVELDLYEMLNERQLSIEEKDDRVAEVIEIAHLEQLLQQHPYDLSGGEQQRLALAKILLLKPKMLFLDEPTKGLDKYYKMELGAFLKNLQKKTGATILMVSHDVEFCARFADHCGLFFDGGIVTSGSAKTFFAGNSFYTTAANRMSRQYFAEAIIPEDVIELCKMNL